MAEDTNQNNLNQTVQSDILTDNTSAVKDTTENSEVVNKEEPKITENPDEPVNPLNNISADITENISREEKLRLARIAMEGFERTVKREAEEKELEASLEKQKLSKLLSGIEHEKELLELMWVNLDDKRSSFKKILEPLMTREEKLESDEELLENKEGITIDTTKRQEVESKRWEIQQQRRKIEEEKWVVEEKINKIDQQIDENKNKYQQLLAEEEKIRKQIKEIDEKIILQEELLRQQRELEEEKIRQGAVRKIEEERKQAEDEKRRLEELRQAEEERKKAEEERKKLETLRLSEEKRQEQEKARLEELKRIELERQRRETQLKEDEERKNEELQSRLKTITNDTIEETRPNQKNTAGLTISDEIQQRIEKEREKQNSNRIDIVERLKQEQLKQHQLAEEQRAQTEGEKIVADKLTNKEDEILQPIRTLKSDAEKTLKQGEASKEDLQKVNKKFPWLQK